MVALPNTAVVLARLDPVSLRPVSRQIQLGEYHDAWSLSPDRSQLALGVSAAGRSGRVGILIVHLEAMKVVQKIETGGAAEALAWLAPDLLVAALVREGTVLVDPRTGMVLRRWPDLSLPQASAPTRDGVVMLFPGRPTDAPKGNAAARLAVVDGEGRLRSISLERIQLALRDGVQWDEAALAVDSDGVRAYAFAADAPAAEIDLGTMGVSYHRLAPLFLSPGELANSASKLKGGLRWRQRGALWLGDGRALVFGRDDFAAAAGEDFAAIAATATLVDTATWSSCVLDASAGGAALVAGSVLVYGRGDPASLGLRAYTVEGREAFHLFDREQVWDVQAAGPLAYVRTRSAVHIVDVRSGKVVSEIIPPAELVDVVAEPS